MSNKLDITEEFLRVGAVRGEILDADGSVLYDLFDEFGVEQKVYDGLGTADVNSLDSLLRDISRDFEDDLEGETMTHPLMLHSRGSF